MKNLLLLFFIVLFFNQTYSQNKGSFYIVYQQKTSYKTEFLNNLPATVRQNFLKRSQWQTAILLQNNKGSMYALQEHKTVKKINSNETDQTITVHHHLIYFKDFIKGKLFTQNEGKDETLVIKSDLNAHKWNLLPDTKLIDNVLCHKATTTALNGQKITAWYTDKYGIQNGPAGYHGLPGLIVLLYGEGNIYTTYKLVKVTPISGTFNLPSYDKNAKLITKEDYLKYYVDKKSLKKGYKVEKSTEIK